MTCSELICLVFSLYCMSRNCLHYALCQKHYFHQREFTLVDYDECPGSRVTLHRSPLFPFPHRQWYLSMTLSLFPGRMLLPHLGHDISFSDSAHCWRNFMVWKQEPKEHILVGKPSARTTLRPKDPSGTMGVVFNFILVSLDWYSKRKHHVIATMFLPHVWKALNLKVNNK